MYAPLRSAPLRSAPLRDSASATARYAEHSSLTARATVRYAKRASIDRARRLLLGDR